jgi:uncharacterized protein (DUF1778 family)
MARPRLKPAQRRDPFQVRMTAAEKKELAQAANLTGLELSTWMRTVCLRQARVGRLSATA